MDENGYESNQRYDGSLKENLPKGLMERLPEELKDKIEDAIAMEEQEKQNRNAYYENVQSQMLTVQMKPGSGIAALIIGIGGMLLFVKINLGIAFLCIGIMLVIFGIGFVSDEKFKFKRHAVSSLVLILGIGIVLISGYLFLEKMIPALPQLKGTFLIGIGIAAVGVLLLILPGITYFYMHKVCTEQVKAACVYLKQKSEYKDGHTYIMYAPVYEYQFRGNTYCVAEDYRSNDVPSIGSRHDLYINPDEPTEFYQKNGSWKSIVALVIFCMVFVAFGCIFCCIP